MIFVFGSNLAGRHGRGAAKEALENHGACEGIGVGPWGSTYAIPTKNCAIKTLPLQIIHSYVIQFIGHARIVPISRFRVTRIGTGLAGYTDEDIAPMFRGAPRNCFFDEKWKQWLDEHTSYWGTHE